MKGTAYDVRVSVLECASPLALWELWVVESGGGPPHSKTCRRCTGLPVILEETANG